MELTPSNQWVIGLMAIAVVLIWLWSRLRARAARDDMVLPPPVAGDLSQMQVDVQDLLAAGQKVEAVKRVREYTGWGLKESKDYVDAVQAGQTPPVGQVVTPAAGKVDEDLMRSEVEQLLRADRKVEAVKRVREYTGWGLKESKDYVDALQDAI